MRILAILLAFIYSSAYSQTGPAGVGSSTTNPLWMKADLGTSTSINGNPVSAWADQSGNANNASQPTANKQPLFQSSVMNGMPALNFDNVSGAANDELLVADNDNLDNTAGLTILSVSRPLNLDGSSARAIVSKRVDVGNNESYLMFYYTSNLFNIDIDGNADRFNSTASFSNNNNYIIDLLYDGTLAAASRAKVYINENLDVTKTSNSASIPNYASNLTIGSLNTGDGRPFGGYIAEVIVFRKALNIAERIIVDNYLSSKYNITLSANDMYAGDATANGDYDFEVAGVGTDASGSNTASASSISGGIAVTQVSGFQNGDYLLYGHTSAQNSNSSSDIGGMTGSKNSRWTRVWYTDVTNIGASEKVNIAFDMSDGGLSVTPSVASNYVLLYRAGQSGNWTEVTTASSISGDNVIFSGVTITADGYYTIGTHDKQNSPLPIQLLDFAGTAGETSVELTWTTASELNNDYFTVERSEDSEHFEKVTDVQGAGNSSVKKSYTTTDNLPYMGRSYYRLSQTDFDGVVTYFKIITVTVSEAIKVYPNPASNSFYIQWQQEDVGHRIVIYDLQGKPVHFEYSLAGSLYTIDAHAFQKGLYIIALSNGTSTTYKKVVIE